MSRSNELEREDFQPYNTLERALGKSNFLIGMKFDATVLELDVTYMGMLCIQAGQFQEKPDGIYVEMNGSDIQRKLGKKNSHSFFERLAGISLSMTGRSMGYIDHKNHEFSFFTLINKAEYKDGTFTMRFAHEARDYLIDVEKGGYYTLLEEEIMYNFKTSWAFKLYEFIKKSCYYPSNYNKPKTHKFLIQVSVAELKFQLGVVNTELAEIKKELGRSNGTDAELARIIEKSPEKKYKEWGDFKKNVLDKAIANINEISDIEISYTTVGHGRGGKIDTIEFLAVEKKYIKNQVLSENVNIPELSEDEQFEFYIEIKQLTKQWGFKLSDIKNISKEANFDIDIVKKSLDMLNQSSSDVKNPVGWLIKCIQDRWYENVEDEIEEVMEIVEEKDDVENIDSSVIFFKKHTTMIEHPKALIYDFSQVEQQIINI